MDIGASLPFDAPNYLDLRTQARPRLGPEVIEQPFIYPADVERSEGKGEKLLKDVVRGYSRTVIINKRSDRSVRNCLGKSKG